MSGRTVSAVTYAHLYDGATLLVKVYAAQDRVTIRAGGDGAELVLFLGRSALARLRTTLADAEAELDREQQKLADSITASTGADSAPAA